jgi:hypothetical protein
MPGLLAVMVSGNIAGGWNWLTNSLRAEDATPPTGGVRGLIMNELLTPAKTDRP